MLRFVEFGIQPRDPEANAHDEAALVWLAGSFPRELVETCTREFFRDVNTQELARALDVRAGPSSLDETIREFGDLLAADAEAEEVDLTISILSRHWCNLLATAWALWGHDEGQVRLDSELMPKVPESHQAEWNEDMELAQSGLMANLPLTSESLSAIMHAFAVRLISSDPPHIPLPGDLFLRRRGDRLEIISADSPRISSTPTPPMVRTR